MRRPRGVCPECGRTYAMSWHPSDHDGGVWAMPRHRLAGTQTPCPGQHCLPDDEDET